REVVGDDPHLASVDLAVPGDDAVGRRAVRVALAAANRLLMREQPELDEGARVEQEVDALADRELAPLVLLRDLLLAAHGEVLLAPGPQVAHLAGVVVHRGQFY